MFYLYFIKRLYNFFYNKLIIKTLNNLESTLSLLGIKYRKCLLLCKHI